MTLTEASFWTKRFGIIIGVVVLVLVIILLLIFYKPSSSLPQEYLTADYGCTEKKEDFIKSKLDIPSLPKGNAESVFEINTDTGKINSLPNIVNVYKFENSTQSLMARENARILAGKMGFEKEKDTRIGTEYYKWSDPVSKKTLTVEVKNMNFVLETDITYLRKLSATGSIPSDLEAGSLATSALRSLGLIDESTDYAEAKKTYTYINIEPDGSFSKARSASEAELVRVDFLREKPLITISSNLVGATRMIENMRKRLGMEPKEVTKIVNDKKVEFYTFNTSVVLPTSRDSNVSVYVGIEDKDSKTTSTFKRIYRIEYTYWPISLDACGTYELITPQKAMEEVQNGKGSIAYLYEIGGDYVREYSPKNVKRFLVTKNISLFYYESPEEQEFLQPIYLISGEAIFEDDTKGEFDIYYPAIDYANVQNKITLPKQPKEESKGLL